MNDQPEGVATGTEPIRSVDPCPLCATPLPDPEGPTEVGPDGRPVTFRHCGRCRSLVAATSPADQPGAQVGGEPAIDLDEQRSDDRVVDPARTLVDEINGAAGSLAWELAEHLPPPTSAPPVVDLGGGRGGIPNALIGLGYRVRSCEPSAFLCQMARATYLLGPDVLVNTDPDAFLDGLQAEPEPLSAIVLWHVLDRHPDPLGLLARCADLAPGAMAFAEFPAPRPDLILAEQRFWATPATVGYLADRLRLTIVQTSVAETGLRVFFRLPEPGVVDLAPGRADPTDLAALESAYRILSPVFAHFVPDPDGADAEPGDSGHAVDTEGAQISSTH